MKFSLVKTKTKGHLFHGCQRLGISHLPEQLLSGGFSPYPSLSIRRAQFPNKGSKYRKEMPCPFHNTD
jgi:hypothetical protein